MPNLVKNLKSSCKDVFKDKVLTALLVIIALVAVNQLIFSYLLVGRDSASAAAGTLGYTAIGDKEARLERVGQVGSNTYDNFEHSVVDPNTGYAFLVDGTLPSNISEYHLDEASPYIRTTNMLVSYGAVMSAVLDTTPAPNGYIYLGTAAGKIIKYNTSSLTLAGELDLSGTYGFIGAGVIDVASGFAYFGTDTTDIIKLELSSFTVVDTVTATVNGNESAVIDLPDSTIEHGYAYFNSQDYIVKVDIDTSRTFAVIDEVNIATPAYSEISFYAMVMDVDNGYIYMGSGVNVSHPDPTIIKVDMGNYSGRSLGRVDEIVLPDYGMERGDFRGAVIDTVQGYAYFAAHVSPSIVYQINIDPNNFSYVDYLTMSTAESNLDSGFIYNNSIYMAENDSNAQLQRIRYSDVGLIKASSTYFYQKGLRKVSEIRLDSYQAYITNSARDSNGNIYYLMSDALFKYNPTTGVIVDSFYPSDPSANLGNVAIDNINGYIYLSTSSIAPQSYIYKIRISDFSLVDTLDVELYNCQIKEMEVDTVNGYLYPVCKISGGWANLLKINTSTFSLVDNMPIPVSSTTNQFSTDGLAIDNSDPSPANHFLYLTERSADPDIHKISIDPSGFSYVGSIAIPTTNYANGIAIDTVNDYAYVVGDTGGIARINIAHPTFAYVDTLTTGIGSNLVRCKIDSSRPGGFLYAIDTSSIIDVYKIKLSDFTLVGGSALALNADETSGRAIDFDLTNSFAYIVSGTTPSKVVKVNIQDPTFSRDSQGNIFDYGNSGLYAGVVDRTNNHGFYVTQGTSTIASKVLKIDLTSMTILDTISLDTGEYSFWQGAFIDEINGYVYFMIDGSPSVIIKIDTGNLPARTFERVTSTILTGYSGVYTAEIDTTNPAEPYAIIADWDSPVNVAKVRLSDLVIVDAITLDAGEDSAQSFFLDTRDVDPANHFAYVGLYTNPAKIVKVSLNPLARIGSLDLNAGENVAYGAVFDQTTGYAYIGTGDNTDQIVKIDVNHPTFSRVGAISLPIEEVYPYYGDIDYNNGILYYSGDGGDSIITAVRLSDFTRIGSFNPGSYMEYPYTLTFNNNYLTFATGSGNVDYVVKMSASSFSPVQINSVNVYSHQAGGDLRLGIYDVYKNLIWESNSLTNNMSNGWLTVSIDNGTPNTLALNDDRYWLAVQTDSTVYSLSRHNVSSYEGFIVAQAYGSFPGTISSSSSYREGYSIYGSVLISSSGGGGGGISSDIPQNVACQALSSDTIRWTFEDSSSSETGFRLYGPEGLIWDSAPNVVMDLSYIDETGLQPGTLYEGRYITVYSGAGESSPSNLASCQTLATEEELPTPEITELLPEGIAVGDVIKGLNSAKIYMVSSANQKRLFPTEVVYHSWFDSYNNVKQVSDDVLTEIALGPNMILRPGTWLMKITTDPKVYAVEPNGVIRWIETEAVALSLYGLDWNKRVIDMPDTYFTDYVTGDSISTSQYPTGTLLLYKGDVDAYYVAGGERQMVSSAAFSQNKFQERFVITNIDPLKYELEEGEPFPVDYDYTMTMTQKNKSRIRR